LPGKLVGGVSGFIVTAYGYAPFFAMTAVIALPILVLVHFATGRSPKRF
jgi:PAT family beta-lactamase induction signal transducer AmpG